MTARTFASPSLAAALAATVLASCSTAGSTWMAEAESADDEDPVEIAELRAPAAARGARPEAARFRTKSIGGEEQPAPQAAGGAPRPKHKIEGRVLGTFRNTYYDFPSEQDFTGAAVSIQDARCKPIAAAPRGFYEALCVQGSGILRSGKPVSFAKRDCDCAEVCPRTGQKICFEALDRAKFPWGRGALGTPIIPLVTVAVDDAVVPMGTGIYVPEFDGVPVDAGRTAFHDGCFVAQDRGLKVKGEHIDVFTGSSETTALWNQLVPSNRGVTVVVDNPKCARAAPVDMEK